MASDAKGLPFYTDFTTMWVAGIQALRGDVALLYDSQEFVRIQTELLGPTHDFYQNWPYPLLLMPLRSGNGDHASLYELAPGSLL
jgi:hypothetical protein